MKKRQLLLSVLAMTCLPFANVRAKETKPVETFIRQVKETNSFVTVANIWQPDNAFDMPALKLLVNNASPLTISYDQVSAFIKQNNHAIDLVLPAADGSTYTIELAQYNPLGNNFEVHARGYNNSDGLCGYTPGLYYSGVVKGIEGSVAAFSFFNNEVYGIFSIPNVGNIVLAPNTMVGEYYNYNQHYLLYNDRELNFKNTSDGCGTDRLPLNYLAMSHNQRTTTTVGNNVYNNCTQVKVYEVADNAMYVKKGSSTTNVTNYLTALFNNQATIYRNEGVPIVLQYVQIDSTTDVYQSITANNSERFLTKFGYTTQNNMHGCDAAILFSTRFNGQMGGIAWLQAGCTGYYAPDTAGPYAFCNINNSSTTTSTAFPTYSWDVEVTSHEMGHTIGSPHTHACCWNPPARNTAIDGCYTLEGSCAMPVPQYPAAQGTIMSYCHLVNGVGINFSNGFGQQPGDTVRAYLSYIFSNGCGLAYNPAVIPSKVGRTLAANRECTDLNTGITYYWNDHNTASQVDDTLVLMIKKNSNNIGSLNTTGFAVSSNTEATYGNSLGDTILFPTGTAGQLAPNYAMHRYWKVAATTQPTTAVEVIFPFLATDSTDIDGSAPGHPSPSVYKMYKVNGTVNPAPKLDSFRYTTTSNVTVYNHGATASTTRWSLSNNGSTYLAHMLMTNLTGGGSGFYSSLPNDIESISTVNSGIYIYPNPTNDQWIVAVDKSATNDQLMFQLYAADGKLVHTQSLQSGTNNTVSAAALPIGVYFYRVISNSNTYTGNLIKK